MSVDFGGNNAHWAERSQSRKKENLTKTRLSCKAHCSYFKRVFGVALWKWFSPGEDTWYSAQCEPFGMDELSCTLRQMMCSGSITLCPSFILVSVRPPPPSRTLSGSFTVRKDLRKQSSWTNRLWDEFRVGFWQRRAEAEVLVSVCAELSKSDKVTEMKTEWTRSEATGCVSQLCEQENTRCSNEKLWNNPSRDVTWAR